MTTSKGRIAQTFPDINSTGLTIGTAAGVRSFPEPFIATPGSVGALIQRGVINVPSGSLTGTLVLGTAVDVSRSWINYRGQNVVTSTTAVGRWRTHLSFTAIVGGFSSTVLATRGVAGTELNIHLTVVSYSGTGGTSIDVKTSDVGPTGAGPGSVEDFTIPQTGSFKTVAVRDPSTGLFFSLGGRDPTNAFVVFRGVSMEEKGNISVPSPDSRFHPEQWHGHLRINTVSTVFELPPGPVDSAAITFRPGNRGNFFLGPPSGCGGRELKIYATLVWFPPPG
jgi:hypothetical protein